MAKFVIATAGVLFCLGLLHVYWAMGGKAGSVASIPESNGKPLFRPGPAASFLVALLLLTASGVVWTRSPLCWLLAAVFLLRAVGEFRYVGFFKTRHGTLFAKWDTQLFSPLCLLISAGSAWTAYTR